MHKLGEVAKYFIKQYQNQFDKNKENKRLKKYYVEAKSDNRGNVAKALDYIGIRVIIFFVCVIIFLISFQNLVGAVLLAVICTTLFHVIDIMIRNKRMNKIIYNRRKYFASERVYKKMIRKDLNEFSEFFCNVLEKSGFDHLRPQLLGDHNILLEANYNTRDLTILCKKYNRDRNVQLKEIQEFHKELEKVKSRCGIVLTTSDFTQECHDYANQNMKGIEISLLEGDKFLKIIDKGGMFPTDEEMDEYIVDRVEKEHKKMIEYKKVFLAKTKVKRYITLSLFLFVWSKFTTFSLYYFTVAVFLFGLAMITIYSNIKNNHIKKQDFDFDQLTNR